MTQRAFTEPFNKAFTTTVGIEGKYSNHPADPGGETKYGITIKVARAWGYLGLMYDLPLEVAKAIYWDLYWRKAGCETIEKTAPTLAPVLFDIAVNTGVSRAVTWLQMSLNALNLQESKYADIVEDGAWGQKTRSAFESFMTWRQAKGELVLVRAVSSMQGHHYITISRNRPDLETFVFGWFLNRIHLEPTL